MTLKERFDKLIAEIDAESAKVDACYIDYIRKEKVPLIGAFYSHRAWRRYIAAYRAYKNVFDANMKEIHVMMGT